MDRAATLTLARSARRMLVKAGDTIVRLERPLADSDVAKYLVHDDGFCAFPCS